MSIVSTSNRWLNRLYKTVAILLVLLAVIISAFRLFLPYVHHYRLPLQNYLNEQSKTHLSIGTLSMNWQRSGPVLVIGDVQVLQTESTSLFIKQLELQVDFWQSISNRELISKNLILSGAKVKVSEQFWRMFEEDEAPSHSADNDEARNISVISDLFLNRINRFSIRDSQIIVRDESITRKLRLNQLHWINNGDRHQAQGSVVVNGLSSNNLQLKIDLKGEHGSDLTGQVYLQANHIDITPWLDNILMLDDDKTKTDINFSAWLKVRHSDINRLYVDFSESNMNWFFENKQQQLTLKKGQLLLVKNKKKRSFNLYSTDLSLVLNDTTAQNFTVMLAKRVENFSLHLSELNVAMLAQLTPLIVAKKETRKLISNMALTGNIVDLYLRKNEDKFQAVANFSALNNNYSHGIPGLKNTSGQISYTDNYFAINFAAEQGELDFDKFFVQPFLYEKLSGQLNVAFDEHGLALTVDKLDFLSDEINLSAQIKVDAPSDGEASLALLASISNGNAGLVGRYLPLPIMSENLVNYLNSAVVSGRIEDAQVLINGPISHFPFTDGSGIFVVDAELSESEFQFVDNWPAITDFVANLNFTNNSMLITGRGGQLTGLNVTGVRAGIADLANGQILKVDAEIQPTAADQIRELMNQSPLKDSVGSTLEHIQVSGDVSGEFHLNLPLNDSEQALASGVIVFDNNHVTLQAPKMSFSEVNGQLTFSNDIINTKNLELVWQNLPLFLEVNGINKADYYETDIYLSAQWQEDDWLAHVPFQLKRYTKGGLNWEGKLSLYQHHQGGFSYDANFLSDLTNTELLLPASYARSENQENTLSVQIDGHISQSNVSLNYGDKLYFSGLLDHETTSFTRANLMLGEGKMALPSDGFHITTKLKQVDFSLWEPLIGNILDAVNQPTSQGQRVSATPFLAKPKRIRGSIEQLEVLGQKLHNVSFNLLDKPDWWLLQLNANETRSQIKIYPDWLEQGLDVNAEFLNIKRGIEDDTKDSSIVSEELIHEINNDIFESIPPFNFHCDSCSIDSLVLGVVDVKVTRVDSQTVELTRFKASRDKAELNITGQWLHNDQQSTTSLLSKFSIADVESELKAFSFESIIKDSGAIVNANVNWAGGFHDFDVGKLNGDIKVELDDGYLADVSDKARLFSVLSLQSLVRKLTLDFRDIFSDGMFYSNIKGDYHLEEGLFTTNNTEMRGTAGDLFVSGHTDLVTGDLDYDMSYKPNLSSSLPVLAWIATLNPVTFLAGVAIDQVIKSQVVSEFKFELTGTIEKPDFKEVDRKSQDISVDNKMQLGEDKQQEPLIKTEPSTKVSTSKKVNNG